MKSKQKDTLDPGENRSRATGVLEQIRSCCCQQSCPPCRAAPGWAGAQQLPDDGRADMGTEVFPRSTTLKYPEEKGPSSSVSPMDKTLPSLGEKSRLGPEMLGGPSQLEAVLFGGLLQQASTNQVA
ncbi:hypothetical protein H1C71_005540 [Ictidomys tridecemlineatus]|nr:hypothetical protein H1C71_005540 [Ictidomys tridecemlineatus]